MSHIPNDLIDGRIKDVVKRDSELDNSKGTAKMPADFTHRINGLPPQFMCKLFQL